MWRTATLGDLAWPAVAKRKKKRRRPRPRPTATATATIERKAEERRQEPGEHPRQAERGGAGEADERWWGLGDVFGGWVIVMAVTTTIGGLVIQSGNYAFGVPPEGYVVGEVAGQVLRGEVPTLPQPVPLWLTALLQIPLWSGLAIVPYVACRRKGKGWVDDLGLRFELRDIAPGLALGVVCQLVFVAGFYWLLFRVIGDRDLSENARQLTDRAEDPLGVVLLVLILGVAAPIAEEIFFRGLAQRSFEKRGFAWYWAIVATALFFAITHFQVLELPGLVIFGLVSGFLAHRAGRIGPAVWAHVGFNLTTVAFLLVLT